LTPIVRGTPSAIAPAAAQSRVPVVIPPLPPNAKLFEFAADPRRTGWLLATEEEPHWGDRNLHAGVYKGQGYQSILAFEASTLAPGSQIIWAEVELTGLNGGNLSSSGRWSLKLFPADWTANWTPGTKVDFRRVLTTEIGTALLSTDLAEGQPNHFVFGSMQLAQLQDALNTTGRIVFVSERSGSPEIYVYNLKTKITTRLTSTPVDSQRGYPPYNKHPSWSPDANQIVFFSDRGTWPPRDQLWVINADGGGMRALGPSPYNDSNPIWIKR